MAKLKNVSKRKHVNGGLSIAPGAEIEITKENQAVLEKLHDAYKEDFLIVTDQKVAFPKADAAKDPAPKK